MHSFTEKAVWFYQSFTIIKNYSIWKTYFKNKNDEQKLDMIYTMKSLLAADKIS